MLTIIRLAREYESKRFFMLLIGLAIRFPHQDCRMQRGLQWLKNNRLICRMPFDAIRKWRPDCILATHRLVESVWIMGVRRWDSQVFIANPSGDGPKETSAGLERRHP